MNTGINQYKLYLNKTSLNKSISTCLYFFIYLFLYLCVTFIHLFKHLFIYSCIYLFIHLFIYSCISLIIYLYLSHFKPFILRSGCLCVFTWRRAVQRAHRNTAPPLSSPLRRLSSAPAPSPPHTHTHTLSAPCLGPRPPAAELVFIAGFSANIEFYSRAINLTLRFLEHLLSAVADPSCPAPYSSLRASRVYYF